MEDRHGTGEGRLMQALWRPTVSVIVPVHFGGEEFRRCIGSLAACRPAPKEIIVVADGHTDGAWRAAREMGINVLRLPVACGPAGARNRGAQTATGDILYFVDADVVVPTGAVGRILSAFETDPDLAALFGSYDDRPEQKNFLSQYKNLFHHYVHQTASTEAATFWAGCGAVRRDVFMALGGFDEGFCRPSIEDIELGTRLRRAGHRIRLDKGWQVTHLKRWGAVSLAKADILYRALPWTELILRGAPLIDDLNLNIRSRMSAVCAWLLIAALVLSAGFPGMVLAAGALLSALLWLNRDIYGFFRRKRGVWFAARTIPMLWLYYLYGSLAFAIGCARHLMERRGRRGI